MLKAISTGHVHIIKYPVDNDADFQPGMIAELKVVDNEVVVGASSGLAPLGIFDDVKEAACQPQIDEEVIIGPDLIGEPFIINNKFIIRHDINVALQHPLIVKNSFTSNYPGPMPAPVIVNYINGTIKVPAGSILNYASTEEVDSIRIYVSYIYHNHTKLSADSTKGTGKATINLGRGIWQTDQYDTTQNYKLNATLFCGLNGKLTSKQPTPQHPSIAIVTYPPHAQHIMLEFLWLG